TVLAAFMAPLRNGSQTAGRACPARKRARRPEPGGTPDFLRQVSAHHTTRRCARPDPRCKIGRPGRAGPLRDRTGPLSVAPVTRQCRGRRTTPRREEAKARGERKTVVSRRGAARNGGAPG